MCGAVLVSRHNKLQMYQKGDIALPLVSHPGSKWYFDTTDEAEKIMADLQQEDFSSSTCR